jgi:signal transduction histidine kinase
METKLAQSNRLASMGFLAAGLAHEINNPLTSILVNLKRLADQLLRAASESRYCRTALVDLVGEEEAKKFHEGLTALAPETLDELADMARIALESGQHVQRIADDLRSVAGTEEDTRVMLQLNDVLGKAMRMSSHEIRERAEPVESYGDLPLIMGNEGRLCQLFLNLLANAVQAIEPGEETTNRIEVRTVRQDREVLVEIVDTGQGIPPRDLERIFDPFFTTKPAGVGCGMGLSICHNIAQTHGGWIQVQSAVGQGSTFAVHLPLPEPVSVPDQRKPIAAKPTQ